MRFSRYQHSQKLLKNKELLNYIYAKRMLKCVAHSYTSSTGVYRRDWIIANNTILPIGHCLIATFSIVTKLVKQYCQKIGHHVNRGVVIHRFNPCCIQTQHFHSEAHTVLCCSSPTHKVNVGLQGQGEVSTWVHSRTPRDPRPFCSHNLAFSLPTEVKERQSSRPSELASSSW